MSFATLMFLPVLETQILFVLLDDPLQVERLKRWLYCTRFAVNTALLQHYKMSLKWTILALYRKFI